MHSSPSPQHMNHECQRLQQQVARDGGTQNLSQTDLAFLEAYCGYQDDILPKVADANLSNDGGIDESAHVHEGNLFGDPNAGCPDDPADANPAAPDPAITRK